MQHPDVVDTYQSNRNNVLSATELNLVSSLHDKDKLQKASLNNVAYAMTQVANLRRLEAGKSTHNLGVSIELKLSKALAKSKITDQSLNNKVAD